ncbi:MAG: hypothetical protein LBG89_02025 [Rickettsiales bacterium]|jgi:hypothetical protein|nr:hypothetical protein [Rickettsiales bacterium]
MKITAAKNAFKIADVKIDHSDILSFIYKEYPNLVDENGKVLPKNFLKKNIGRVYLIVVNGTIVKIGGSEAAGGMQGTLSIYKDGGLNGQPSPRSIGVWWHLFHELVRGNKVEFFMIYQDSFKGDVKGLSGVKRQDVSISYKHIELACLADYFAAEHKYPDWNYQENHTVWEAEIEELHKITKANKGKKGTAKNLDFRGTLKKGGFNTKIKRNPSDYK